jgi:hypothetical protein
LTLLEKASPHAVMIDAVPGLDTKTYTIATTTNDAKMSVIRDRFIAIFPFKFAILRDEHHIAKN